MENCEQIMSLVSYFCIFKQEEIVAKFVWLGQKMGLSEKTTSDEDETPKLPPDASVAATSQQPAAKIPETKQPASSCSSTAKPPFSTSPVSPIFSTANKQPMVYQGTKSTKGADE